jgi:NADH-quinone oxidoreductase subunit B
MASTPNGSFSELKQEQVQQYLHDSITVPEELQANIMVSTLDKVYNWSRSASVWPLFFGLACCAIEMIATAASRYDLARFGMEVMRPSPRQADLMIVSGTVTKKMLPAIIRIYNQMAEPRYVLSMGACATGGGPFKEGYSVVSGIDKYVPVDVYVPGCPPTPEALIFGLLKLREKIERQSIMQVPWYRKDQTESIPIPILGPDIFDPRQVELIKEHTLAVAEESSSEGGKAAGGKQREAAGKRPMSDQARARIEQAKARAAAKKS